MRAKRVHLFIVAFFLALTSCANVDQDDSSTPDDSGDQSCSSQMIGGVVYTSNALTKQSIIPRLHIDTVNDKALIGFKSNYYGNMELLRCEISSTISCVTDDIPAYARMYSPDMWVDSANNRINTVFDDQRTYTSYPYVASCTLEATGCSGQTYSSLGVRGYSPDIILANNKSLIATYDDNGKPSLILCDNDGTNCAAKDVSAGQGSDSGYDPDIAYDFINDRILIVTSNGSSVLTRKPSLFRCDQDGENCTHQDLTTGTGQGEGSGNSPNIAIDTINDRLIVATQNAAANNRLSLFVCNLSGTSCSHTDLSALVGDDTGFEPSLALDLPNNKLYVAARNNAQNDDVWLFRCNLDGSSCTHHDASACGESNLGFRPSAVLDSLNNRLLIASTGLDEVSLVSAPLTMFTDQ